jgi:signal transduction histidine kinase/CheY-like chemotaxis protein
LAEGQQVVLVVDDEAGVRAVIRRTLENRGFRVLEAEDVAGALAEFEREKGRIDLLIADVMLPNLSGFELFQRLEEQRPGLRALYISGYLDHAPTLEPGMTFLHKPFGIAELLSKVDEVIARAAPQAPVSRPGPLTAPQSGAEEPGKVTARVLLAAPNPSEARFIGNFLEAAAGDALRVDAASTPDGARRMAHRKGYQLVVLDVELVNRDPSLLTELSTQAPLLALMPADALQSAPAGVAEAVRREGPFLSRLADRVCALTGLAPQKAPEPRRRDHLETICHDLRNPASTILGFSDVLLDNDAQPLAPQQRSALTRIRRNAAFLLDLISSIMDSERLDHGEMPLALAEHDLTDVVRETLEDFKVKAESKRIALDAVLQATPVIARFDRGRMVRVIGNLLSNALKFSHPGTAVEVGVRAESGVVELWVKDQGQGIPAEERDNLFRKFGRTSVLTTQGEHQTGLGLYIVKQILDLHGATIDVTSEPGRGTTFLIRIDETRAPLR